MEFHTLRATALAAGLMVAGISAHAQAAADQSVPAEAQGQLAMAQKAAKMALDDLGIELWGYGRGGFYGSNKGQPKGKYAVGDLGYYRLGNEGDNYLEFGIGKKWTLNGVKAGVYWMPYLYDGLNGATNNGTKQFYADISGLEFMPQASFWAGQRYHRIQDIHIIDNWLMEDGDNYGAGVDGIPVGGGKGLNIAVYTDGSTGNGNATTANGKRINFQLRDLPVNPNGALTITGGYVRGKYADDKKDGFAIGALHNQKDLFVKGLLNSVFLQGSNGHASLTGKFNPVDAKQFRIIESINWQTGAFGGQALIGYQSYKPTATGIETKDSTIGGRVTYGVAKNIKLEGEAAIGMRKITNQDSQRLTKATFAVGFAPNTDFWTRPEFRLYVTQANWNDATNTANGGAFSGTDGQVRKNATIFGAQMEAWW